MDKIKVQKKTGSFSNSVLSGLGFKKNKPTESVEQSENINAHSFCSDCGAKVNENSKFCSNCGKKI